MNIVLLRFCLIIAGLAILDLLLLKLLPERSIKGVYKAVEWLIEKTYLFFVDILIFLKPLRKHRETVGLVLWVFFVVILGRYLIVEQPLTSEITPAYLPFIGYIYFLSVLYMIKIIFKLSGKYLRFDEHEVGTGKE